MIPKFLKPITSPFRIYYLPLLWKPKPEPEGLKLYPRFVSRDDVVIEVGARMGGGTLLLSKLAKYVYSFEPNPHSFRFLEAFMKKNKNSTLFPYGCGAENMDMVLNIMEDNKLSNLASINKRNDVQYDRKEKIKIIKLDDFKFDLKPNMLIIDCESFEAEVLKGARKLLNKIDKVLVELHTLPDGKNTLESVSSELKDFNLNMDAYLGWLVATRKRS